MNQIHKLDETRKTANYFRFANPGIYGKTRKTLGSNRDDFQALNLKRSPLCYFQNGRSFAFSGPLLTKGEWPEKMPAKLQYEAFVGILIIHNFGFFWQSEINLSVLWGGVIPGLFWLFLPLKFCVWQGFLLDEIK